ncbi:hypothetical protein BHZ80_29105, partial [Salmonella enterica]|nr:hypothetical protein [Salmonella enterica]EAA9599174.1 hypothetical protein [Salmonella enterica]EAO9641850.1 hypothetical protein [Salmonella enterica]
MFVFLITTPFEFDDTPLIDILPFWAFKSARSKVIAFPVAVFDVMEIFPLSDVILAICVALVPDIEILPLSVCRVISPFALILP